mmetsp:Transcript_19729/g.2673  ORF Transcript_19729/g.2673 Transcript_19729/m.2673 type:complete len:114 (-) Transcript_19729:150-491(-)
MYLFDKDLTRPIRFTLIYAKLCLVLGISGTMASALNQYETILWAILVGILTAIPLVIIKILIIKKGFLKFIAVILVILAILVGIYIALVNAALMEIEESNSWAMAYISSFIMD